MPFLEVNGGRLFYERRGEGRPSLCFIHGYCRRHDDWRFQVAYFQPRYVVITCDLPGHGLSDILPGDLSIEDCGAYVAALIDRLAPAPTLMVGHSMGCRIALEAALSIPQTVCGVILIDGSWVSGADLAAAQRERTEAQVSMGYAGLLRKQFEEMFFSNSDRLVKHHIIAEALATPQAIGEPLFLRAMEWDAHRMEPALSRVTAPLLILQSTAFKDRRRVQLEDGETTPWLQLVKSRVSGAVIKIVPEVGHFSMLEAPALVNEEIERFVQGLSSRRIP